MDRNHVVLVVPAGCWLSLSARRAWIEIIPKPGNVRVVESLSARRAWIEIGLFGVDTVSHQVALRKESVDRNHVRDSTSALPSMSLSARRAWIEMPHGTHRRGLFPSLSARRAWIEITYVTLLPRCQVSLSARRAWIEIHNGGILRLWACVALRKESVDRNPNYIRRLLMSAGRSPQGERG